MNVYNDYIAEDKCTGCGACENICPNKSIKMELNNDGFYVPFCDDNSCLSCGLCEKICPVLHRSQNNYTSPICYAIMASDEIRAISSSGGAFQILAELIIKKDGVVCGAAWNDDYKSVHHILINSTDELYKLRGSKYIMSNMSGIYGKIKSCLDEEKYVLFSGTPCEVAGLNAFLGEHAKSDYLLTIDLICHGIPSVKAFRNYIRDNHGNKEIKYVGFKDKKYGWHASMTIQFTNDELYNCPCETDDYFRSYLNGVNKNKACGDCQFASLPRQGDFTIGDYWGIDKVDPAFNDHKRTSVMLFNTDKSKKYLDDISASAKLFEETDLDGAINGNNNLIKSPKNHISRNQFFRNLDNRRYSDLTRWSLTANRYDIGLVGIPTFPNFGGALTYYALYRTLTDKGLKVAVFSRPRSTGRNPIPPEDIYTVNPYDRGSLLLDYRDKEAMESANDICENFLVGSDQLFNADLYKKFGEIVALDWISDNHRKVAYAASFGHNFFWGDERLRAKMAHYMQKFDAFSTREEDGVWLAEKTFGVEADCVIDPVFLCDKKYYEMLSAEIHKDDKPHIFAYILDPDDNKMEIVNKCSEKLNLPIELYSEMLYKPNEEKLEAERKKFSIPLLQGNVNERLHSLINSDFIVADSFHGICFAIIFEKPFIAVLNTNRGASRFYSVLGKLNLLDHLVVNVNELSEKNELVSTNATYTESMIILEKEKERCLNWLFNALYPENQVKKAFSDDDIVDEKLKTIKKYNQLQELKMNALLSGYEFYKCRNIFTYVDLLKANAKGLIILITVKDTPGFNLTESIQRKLETLGIKQTLVDKHWHSYVAVIDGGKVIYEKISKRDERVAYVENLYGKSIKLVSRSYNQGNIGAAFIDGIDYSENKRGLNFVIYDKVLTEVVDSVSFDTHSENNLYYRFGKAHHSLFEVSTKVERMRPWDTYVVPKEIKKEDSDVYFACRLIADKYKNRNVVLWGRNNAFKEILHHYFGIEVEEYNDNNIHVLNKLFKRDNENFIVIPNKKFDNSIAEVLKREGYIENEDVIWRYIRPIILKDRDYGKEPYYDIYGNRITGEFSGPSSVILRGYNVDITLGSHCTFGGNALLKLDIASNSMIDIGDGTRFINEVLFFKTGICYGKIYSGKNVVYINNEIRNISTWNDTIISIGNGVTFNPGDCLHCFEGKCLTIEDDVMFSLNVRIMCGDGHSLFDCHSRKNINSLPLMNPSEKNEVVIGRHTWIGINATILSGSKVGAGSIIGANALVKGEFPNNCSIGGNPAKIIKKDIAWSRKASSNDISDCGKDNINTTNLLETKVYKTNVETVLVLGGTRFMGIRLVEKLLEAGFRVTIANRGTRPDQFGDKVKRVLYNRNELESIKRAFEHKKYDVVIDTSAYNSLSVKNILDNVTCKKYIQVSSVAVYPKHHLNLLTDEYDSYKSYFEIGNEKEYFLGKRNSECVALQEYKDIQSIIVRIPFVVEPESLENKELNMRLFFYVDRIYSGKPFYVDNMEYCCSFVRTIEEAEFLSYLVAVDYTGILNFSSIGYVKVSEIIQYVEEKLEKKAIISEDGDLHPFNGKHFGNSGYSGYSMNVDKVKDLGYRPSMLDEWIWKLLDHYIEIVSNENKSEIK